MLFYLDALGGKEDEGQLQEPGLLRIGELAKRVGVPNSTIRHWTKSGLLDAAEVTPSGYQLYDTAMVARIERIRDWQEKRLTLAEIREKLTVG